MDKNMQKNIILFSFLCLLIAGCVTVPPRELAIPSYNINGITYLPLPSLCDLRNINWDYDTITKAVTLKKDSREINLLVGNSVVLIDGIPKDLKYPVDVYKGMVVVPYRFKSDIVDVLFKPAYPKEAVPSQYITAIRKVVIDAGHGGRDPGAIGVTGLREKDLSLDVAKRLKIILESYGLNVYLTRDCDRFVPLEERARLANRRDADIFISIHANANRVRSLSGLEVYYISNKVDDSRRAQVSADNADLRLENASYDRQNPNLKATVWDIIYGQNRSESIQLARSICNGASRNLDTRVLGIKGAPFYVLKWTQMPSVLVEIGFLSNSSEERLLRNGFYRQQIAEAIAEGVRSYCQDYKFALGSSR